MPDQNSTPTPTTEASTTSDGGSSLDARIASVNAMLGDGAPEPAADAALSSTPTPSADASAADSGDAIAKRSAERRARLDAIAAKMRDSVDAKAKAAQAEKLQRDLEAAQKRIEEAERAAQSRVDIESLDEASFFRLAEKKGIRPDRLAEWIRDSMVNPERVAEAAALEAARQAVDPKLSAVEKELAAMRERLAAYEAREEQARAAAEEQRQTQAFLHMVSQSAERAPLSVRLLQADPQEFLQIAAVAAERVPGMGAEALLDAVEDVLDTEARAVAQKYATIYGVIPSKAAVPPASPRPAAAQANTVSNSLAQGRSAIVEEDDFAKLPLEERAARLIKSL